jgi:hypothetical protein
MRTYKYDFFIWTFFIAWTNSTLLRRLFVASRYFLFEKCSPYDMVLNVYSVDRVVHPGENQSGMGTYGYGCRGKNDLGYGIRVNTRYPSILLATTVLIPRWTIEALLWRAFKSHTPPNCA